jgi:hypothetical protein
MTMDSVLAALPLPIDLSLLVTQNMTLCEPCGGRVQETKECGYCHQPRCSVHTVKCYYCNLLNCVDCFRHESSEPSLLPATTVAAAVTCRLCRQEPMCYQCTTRVAHPGRVACCMGCDQMMCLWCRMNCINCTADTCSECLQQCDGCYAWNCTKCLGSCAGCAARVCDTCLVLCNTCNIWTCMDCRCCRDGGSGYGDDGDDRSDGDGDGSGLEDEAS